MTYKDRKNRELREIEKRDDYNRRFFLDHKSNGGDIELIRGDNDLFLFNGDIEYCIPKTTYKDFQGVTYANTVYEDIKSTIYELRKKRPYSFYTSMYNFELLKFKIRIEDRIDNSFAKVPPFVNYSENNRVNLIIYAFNKGLLDSRIKSVFSGKSDQFYYYPINYKKDWMYILKTLEVNIPLFYYGFNNAVYYKISLETLLNCDSELIPEDIFNIFKRFDINLSSTNILQQVTNLLIQKTRKL
jgi:hypothetical protein